jgi:adenylosuccinate synthase
MRVGPFDAVLARYAVRAVGGVDGLAVTCLDEVEGAAELWMCDAYRVGAGTVRELHPSWDAGSAKLHRQQTVGQGLACVEPVYEEIRGACALEWIQEKLGERCLLASDGPTHEQKLSSSLVEVRA